ncbi:hypothetical protein DFH06DRAFT_1164912 [Mycena polygramma]|nr:hypothetical protein DFH06DRAFT_1164912 [Mycena polygramma]
MTRISQETHGNARIVPVEARPAASSTNLASITEQLNQQNAAVHEEYNRLQTQLAENQSAVLARLDSLPILTVANPAASQYGSIACVRYVQDAAVLAYPIVRWIDPNDGCTKNKALGSYSPVGIQEEFNLMEEGIPDGTSATLSSYVAGVGEYTSDRWFKVDSSGSQGAMFRQTGTAFKGWFQYMGLYRQSRDPLNWH